MDVNISSVAFRRAPLSSKMVTSSSKFYIIPSGVSSVTCVACTFISVLNWSNTSYFILCSSNRFTKRSNTCSDATRFTTILSRSVSIRSDTFCTVLGINSFSSNMFSTRLFERSLPSRSNRATTTRRVNLSWSLIGAASWGFDLQEASLFYPLHTNLVYLQHGCIYTAI